MMRGSALIFVILALTGCSGGAGGIGDSCSDNSDCNGADQCLNSVCVARCQRAPECGDGYSCDKDGLCHLATLDVGARCVSEVDCAPGLSCQINGTDKDAQQHLIATCTQQNSMAARPSGSPCDTDGECRNGTCALGHCVDLCTDTRDCADGQSCAILPRVTIHSSMQQNDGLFAGCLQANGFLSWTIPTSRPSEDLLLPLPDTARSVSVSFAVDDPNQLVGLSSLTSPTAQPMYTKPCTPTSSTCPDEDTELDQYYSPANLVRHMPQLGQSVLAMPSSTRDVPQLGVYEMTASSFRSDGGPGSSIPRVTAVIQLDTSSNLDLHFYFLDLGDHPCEQQIGAAPLNAQTAQTLAGFQSDYLSALRAIFVPAGITVGAASYDDIVGHDVLMSPEPGDLGNLLALGTYTAGINVYFVRSILPAGVQAFGPNPGPAGIAGSRQSGIAIGVDTLCYRSWAQVARLTARIAEVDRAIRAVCDLDPTATEQAERLVVAYEPVWAIGTGEVATPEDAQEVCAALRTTLAELYSEELADGVRVLH